MGLSEEVADPTFEALLSQFQQIHQNGLARLKIHADAAVAIVQENLTKVYGVKHSPVTAGYKDSEKAVKTLRRRQRERITLGELSTEIERRGEVWAEHCKKWNLQDKETEIEGFQNVSEMFAAMHDLARFRISLTYSSDTGKVIDFLRHHFEIVSGPAEKGGQQKEVQRLHKRIEQNAATSNDKSAVFPGYKATHVIICHKASHPVRQIDDTWKVVIEIQIGTVAMYDWSEIEHDIIYKPQGGITIPDDAERILDMINGVTIIGDMMKDHFRSLLSPPETNEAVSPRSASGQRSDPVQILNKRDRDILRDFGGTDPTMDKIRIEETKGSLFRDSYKWVLENDDFLRWNDEGEQSDKKGWSRRLWIRGDAGKGKTMLLCGIITELMENKRGDYNICYFFCQASDAHLNNATSALRGLMHLLVRQQPLLMACVHDLFGASDRQMFEGSNAWFRAKDTFNRMLSHRGLRKTYIIIDALDECEYQQSELINWILELSRGCNQIKWLVSSRNWPPIVEALETFQRNAVLSLELNAESVSAAVSAYIRYKVKCLAERKSYSDFTRAVVQQYLLAKADHTFLWVALVCQHLDKTRLAPNELREKLPNMFPQGLDRLYARMLDMISEDDIDGIADQCICILAVMTVSYEPLALRELMVLIQPSQIYSGETKVIESRVLYCGSFLALREGTVYFVHQSAQEYLSKDGAKQITPLGLGEEHYRLYLRSLDVLEKILHRNVYNVTPDNFACSVVDIVRPDPDPLASVKHSMAHWIDHFLDSVSSTRPERASEDLSEGGRVYMFLSRTYLYWLEALSLQSDIYRGVTAMTKLAEFSKHNAGRNSHELIWDLQKFIQTHSTLISNTPLQLYMSTLVFSPSQSISRRIFSEHEPVISPRKPPVSKSWSIWHCEVQNALGRDLTFSPNSRFIASAAESEVRIWEVDTGRLQLKVDIDHPLPVCFSADSKMVVLAGRKGDIHFYSTDTTVLTYSTRLMDCGLLLTSLAMSPNAQWFIYSITSEDTDIENWELGIWNIGGKDNTRSLSFDSSITTIRIDQESSTPSCPVAVALFDGSIKVFQSDLSESRGFNTGYRIAVCSFSLSLDLCAIVELYGGGSFRIYDISKGVPLRTFHGHKSRPSSIIFANSHLLFSAGTGDVIMWNVADGTKIWTEEVDRSLGYSISLNSTWVAVSAQERLRLAKLDDLLQHGTDTSIKNLTWEQHRKTMSYSFSPNSTWLAATTQLARQVQVKVWNISSGGVEKLFDIDKVLPSLSFSPDSSMFAIGPTKLERHVSVWECDEWKQRITIATDMDLIGSVSFSTDSTQLAVVHSSSTTVEVWDIFDGSMVYQFLGDAAEIPEFGVAITAKFIVIGSDSTIEGKDGSVLILNRETGGRTYMNAIERGIEGIYSLAISPDSEWIAVSPVELFSKHNNFTVLIVRTQDGERSKELGLRDEPNLHFTSNSILSTGHGEIDIELSSGDDVVWLPSRYGLEDRDTLGRQWVTKYGKRWLILPAEMKVSSWASHGSVLVIKFSHSDDLVFLS